MDAKASSANSPLTSQHTLTLQQPRRRTAHNLEQWVDLPLPFPPMVSTILVTVEIPAGVLAEWPARSWIALHDLVEGNCSCSCRSYNAGCWHTQIWYSVPQAASIHASIIWQSCSQVLSMKQQNSSSCLLSWSTALEHPYGQPSM